MPIKNFNKIRNACQWLAQRGKVNNLRVKFHETKSKESLYLHFNCLSGTLTLQDEGGTRLSERVTNTLMPYALMVLAQIYESEQKKFYAQSTRSDTATRTSTSESAV